MAANQVIEDATISVRIPGSLLTSIIIPQEDQLKGVRLPERDPSTL